MHKLKNNSIWRNFQLNVDNNARLLLTLWRSLIGLKKENMPTQPIRSRNKNKQTNKQTNKKTGNGHSRFSRA